MQVTKNIKKALVVMVMIAGFFAGSANAYYHWNRNYHGCWNGYCHSFNYHKTCSGGYCHVHETNYHWYR